jgi:hypothetical protein
MIQSAFTDIVAQRRRRRSLPCARRHGQKVSLAFLAFSAGLVGKCMIEIEISSFWGIEVDMACIMAERFDMESSLSLTV